MEATNMRGYKNHESVYVANKITEKILNRVINKVSNLY